ncbi:MAG TPA: 2OG-Fe(II) oxygenase [Gammaproteobacteria bacterium]|jgi:hypothetical protein|nr:2OG-Fe(II) oxygenase [Gammaproteobacteria bacterium]
MKNTFINDNALQKAPLKTTPFPYCVIPNFIQPEYMQTLAELFPQISHGGSLPASSMQAHETFHAFVRELEGQVLKQAIAEKFSLDLSDKPTMLTLRGMTRERDGVIHTDSKSKLITLLLYMNPTWESDGGKLRLLKNQHSLDDYVEEISPLTGSCVIFQVTRNGWHGHKPYVGKRLSLQLNYLVNDTALHKHFNHHRFTAWLKRLFKRNQEMY